MNKEIYNSIRVAEQRRHHTVAADTPNSQLIKGGRSGLSLITLKDFLYKYGECLQNYYGEDFYTNGSGEVWSHDNTKGCESDTMILCMADLCEDDTVITKKSIRKSLRRAGSKRRRRIKHRYSYENPMNRIHGFIVLTRVYIPKYPKNKVMSISTIATSIFSDYHGIGSDLMDIIIHLGKVCRYDDIILEVANDFAYNAFEEDSEEEEEEGEDEEEEDNTWYPTEEVLDVISHELWRKTMRKPEGINPYYNLGKDYIWNNVNSYLLHEVAVDDQNDIENEMNDQKEYSLSEEPEDYEYGGFWYKKGKLSQRRLMEFYEKFGFVEDSDIYLNWACYDEYPYPTMRYSLIS